MLSRGALPALLLALAAAAPDPAWNGHWVLDRARAEPEGAAPDYRFTVQPDGALVWEIPSLDERNPGRLDGKPFPIRRHGAPTGSLIAVQPEGGRVWRYRVEAPGRPPGGGIMTLAPDGSSWRDVPVDAAGQPVLALRMQYIRR